MATFQCRIILLDDTFIERDLEKKAVGQVLFDSVCEYLSLLEKDYFGLAAWDSSNSKVWLDLSKKVHKQIISQDTTFSFCVKFYPPDPSVLAEDITRYLLCLQLRTDILTGRLPCPSDMLAVLGSYTIQSEFGDYNPDLHGKEFFSTIPLAPNQTPELEEKVAELHHTLNSMTPAEADQLFLQNAKTLDMYGMHLHPAKDASGGAVMLGVCADGLVVYEDEEKTQCFLWPSVLNMSYRRNIFQARIFHSEEASENTITFSMSSHRACKRLWRNAAEHHGFFRNHKNLDKVPMRLLRLGSRFRFHGLTHAESLEASSTIDRPAPHFSRSGIKRKANESDLVASKRPSQPGFDDWLQVLGSDESSSRVQEVSDEQTGGETFVYKERQEMDKPDNERSQLLGEPSVPTQHSLSFLSSEEAGVSERATFRLRKLEADDWFLLLEPRPYQPLKKLPLSLPSSQSAELKEELKWIEQSSERSIKVIKIRKGNGDMIEQSEELEMGPDFVGENLELDAGCSEQMLKVMRKKIELKGDGEEIQTVLIYEKRMQGEEASGEAQMPIFEQVVREGMLKTDHVVSEESIEELEERLLEVENIGQRLQDIERMKVRLQEVEFLDRKLQQAQQAGRQRAASDDWYILLEHKLMEASAAAKHLGVETSEENLQDVKLKRQERGEADDWQLSLDDKPLVVSSAGAGHTMDTAEREAEIIQWGEDEPQRASTRRPVQMKDDWYILLELLPQATQTVQPAVPPSAPVIDTQSSLEHVAEEHENLSEETKWTEERTIYLMEPQATLPAKQPRKQVDDDWFTQLDVSPKDTVIDTQSSLAHVADDHINLSEETKWTEERTIHLREAEATLPAQRAKQTQKQVDDDWFTQLDVSPKDTVIDTQSSLAYGSDDHINLSEQTKWTEERTIHLREAQATLPAQRAKQTQKQVDDDWFTQLDVSPRDTVPATAVYFYEETREEDVQFVKKQGNVVQFNEERIEIIGTSREVEEMRGVPTEKESVLVALKRPARTEVDDWFQVFGSDESRPTYNPVSKELGSEDAAGLRYQQTVTIKEREVTFDNKPMIIKEMQVVGGGVEKKAAATVHKDEDNWFVVFAPAQIEREVITTAGVSDAWKIMEEKQLRDMQKEQLREDMKKVEDRRVHLHLPEPKAEAHKTEVIDNWFILLAPVSKKSVSVHVRAEEDQRRKEELSKKQIVTEDRRKVEVIKLPSVPVIPLTPADQPMTSTPTAQSIRITRPAYKDERLKRIDVTQEITQDIKDDSKVETTIIRRERRDKRADRESIYVRHSILMLEDSDVTQEVVLRHHESVSKLKRLFMEDVPVFGPTDWDRRLSSYTPVVYPKLFNGDLFTGLELMAPDGILVM